MNIRPGGGPSLQLAYAVGRFEGNDDAFAISQLGGDSPLGSVLCSLGTDYAVHVNPDGSGASTLAGLDVTAARLDAKGWYIKDTASGEVWSPFFLPTRQSADEYEVSYLPGQVTVYSLRSKVACYLTIATVPGKDCELWRVRLENRSAGERSLTFTTYAEPGIGPELETGYVEQHKALLMGRPLSALADGASPLRDMVFFMSSTLTPTRFCTDRQQFIGEGRTLHNPEYLDTDEHAGEDGITGAPVASLTVEAELPIEGEAEFGFCLGMAQSAEQALQIVTAFSRPANISAAIEASIGCWQDLLSTVVLKSQDRAANALVSTWLPYEAYAAWLGQRTGGVCLDPGRAADALRRVYALAASAPDQCRESLLRFANGISLAGSYSPDAESTVMLPAGELLWLPVCVAHYIAETGDEGLLLEEVGLAGEPRLTLGEHCERIVRLCASSGGQDSGMLERAIRSWALIDTTSVQFAALRDAMLRRMPASSDESPEQRGLPRRVKFFQSLTCALSEGRAARNLERVFGTELGPSGDAGAACCAYAALVEDVLGLEATAQGLRVRPDIPLAWQECGITRRYRNDTYNISITRSPQPRKSGMAIVVDGEPLLGDMLPYLDDGLEHQVDIVLG